MPTINRQKFIEFLAKNESAAKFFIDHISHYSNVLDMSFIEQHGDPLSWEYLSGNKSLPWNEALIERYADKWDWYALSGACSESYIGAIRAFGWEYSSNGAIIDLFNSWTKQEISTALEKI